MIVALLGAIAQAFNLEAPRLELRTLWQHTVISLVVIPVVARQHATA
jgi:hypothetical protein